jgi:hypothetical protein
MTSAAQLLEALATLRRHWRRRVLLESAAKIGLAALVAIAGGFLLSAVLGGGTGTVVAMRFVGYAVIIVAVVRFLALPLLRRAGDDRFALYVEEHAPELRQALVSAVHELTAPEGERASPSLAARLVARVLGPVRALAAGATLERSRMARAWRALGIVALAGALALAFGPPGLRRAASVLFAPWSDASAAMPVFAIRVVPGDAAVPRGGAVDVRATPVGFRATGADLVFRGDTAADWVRLPMAPDSTAGFTSRLFDLTQPTEYYVEAEGVRSPAYRLSVSDLPAVSRIALDLAFPPYTGLAPERIENGGDVAAVVGTVVTVRALVSRPVRGGALRFDTGAPIPLVPESDSVLTGSFRVRADGFYRVDLVAADGRAVPGSVQYAVEALDDRAPTVFIDRPGRDVRVTNVEEVTIAARASDDYGVGRLELRYTVNGGDERAVVLADSTRRGTPELRAAHTLFLEELGLVPGDLVSYHAVAVDGVGNAASSDVYFLEVRPFSRNYRQADQGGGGGGGGGDSPDGLARRQRQIVAGTFNWLRDSAATAERQRREDVTTLAIAQGRLREDVTTLVRRMTERGVARADTVFRQIHAQLDSATSEMQAAEERLGRGFTRDALGPEQRALAHLQRAEAQYRDVQVQMGNEGGGGGSGTNESNAEELADLFELETDKLRNQYESVQRQSEQSSERELDESAERLRQLASRLQQENERAQRLAEAMRERLGQQGGGGGGGGPQRELARQAEEEARRLERLSRERDSRELAEAAQRLREAAEAMRRSASGAAGRGTEALDQLRRATRDLDNARSTELTEGIRRLAERARELEQRQHGIAQGVAGLAGVPAAERAERLGELGEQKDALADDVAGFEADAERLARQARRGQPAAASKLGAAAETIRENRVRDKIEFSKSVMRGGSSEYANAFEEQISHNLHDAAERLREATGAIAPESADRQRERALENARELVRGLESLRQRTGGQRGGQEGQQGQQGQGGPGQEQTRGQGETPGGAPSDRLGAGDARQFSREFRVRRQAAEELRRDLTQLGIEPGELDRAIADLRRLESGRPLGDPQGLDQLQASVIESLKEFEFRLYRRLGLGADDRPVLGAPAQVPPEYRALVEEYYRSLAGRRERQP